MIPPTQRDEITTLLLAWRGGDETALNTLMPLVYRNLKQIATYHLRTYPNHDTLGATVLVHEIFPRLLKVQKISWADSAHFFAMCSRLMRRVLVEHARHHQRDKRGSGMPLVIFDELLHPPDEVPLVLEVDEALRELAKIDPERARLVELRFFSGLKLDEIAEVANSSTATVKRRLRSARAWLRDYLKTAPR